MGDGGYTLRTFGTEILVVGIGVLAGLAGETWLSNLQGAADAREALVAVGEDLDADLGEMRSVLGTQRALADSLDFILSGASNTEILERAGLLMQTGLTQSPTVYPRRGAYAAMSTAGHFTRLRDPELTNALTSVYERDYARLEYQGTLYDADMADAWDAYRRVFDWQSGAVIENDPVAQVRFINELRLWRLWIDNYRALLEDTSEKVSVVQEQLHTSERDGGTP